MILKERGLVTEEEIVELKLLKKKPSAVYVWTCRLIHELCEKDKLSIVHAQVSPNPTLTLILILTLTLTRTLTNPDPDPNPNPHPNQRLEACLSGCRGLAAKQIAYTLTPIPLPYFHLMM